MYNGQHNEPLTVVEVKLHRHTIEIAGLTENEAMELEELLKKATKIKVRRYDNEGSKKVQSDKSNNR